MSRSNNPKSESSAESNTEEKKWIMRKPFVKTQNLRWINAETIHSQRETNAETIHSQRWTNIGISTLLSIGLRI